MDEEQPLHRMISFVVVLSLNCTVVLLLLRGMLFQSHCIPSYLGELVFEVNVCLLDAKA